MRSGTVTGTGRVRWTRSETAALAAIYLAVLMCMLDVSIVVLAVPDIQRDLDASPVVGAWTMAAYTLCLASLSLTAGALGDRYGRRRVFLAGVVAFAVGTSTCALAPGAGVLVAGRLVQGAGAAAVVPGSLALLARTFTDRARQARVLAGWSTVAGAATLVGPPLGGVLVDAFGWPSIFWSNLPLAAVALVLGRLCVPESADPGRSGPDPLGQMLGIGWLAALTYGLGRAGDHGWRAAGTWVPLAVAAVALAGFVAVELRQPAPMLPVRLLARPAVALPLAVSFGQGFSLFSLGVFVSSFLQQGLHLDARRTALVLLPAAVIAVGLPFLTGRALAGANPRRLAVAGSAASVAGLAGLLLAGPGGGAWVVAAALVLANAGYSLSGPATNAALLASAGERTGIVSAATNAVRHTGTTLGVAVLGTVFAASVTGVPAGRGRDLAVTAGLHAAAVVAAAVAAAVTVAAVLGPRWSRPQEPTRS